jgi:hypothetical protein
VPHNKNYHLIENWALSNRTADYVYDFGDSWEHKIQLEKILLREKVLRIQSASKGKEHAHQKIVEASGGMKSF